MLESKRIIAAVITTLLVLSYLSITLPPVKMAEAQQDETNGGRNWIMPDGNRQANQFNPQTQINKQNVQLLELKWIFPFPASANIGGYLFSNQQGASGTPLVIDGIVYLSTNFGRYFALDASNGKQLWTYQEDVNLTRDIARGVIVGGGVGATGLGVGHTHGISYAEGKIYLPTTPCNVTVLDALSGKELTQIRDMCVNVPGNNQMPIEQQRARGFNVPCSNNYKGHQSYGPTIVPKDRVIIVPAGVVSESSAGARGFFAAYNMDTYQLMWRLFITPPNGGDPEWTLKLADKGWIQGVKASTLPREILLNDWGKMECVAAGPAWGQYAYDEETGVAYLATIQPSPQQNGTYRPGPNALSNSILAVKYKTGELLWWHQTTTHDLWDWDCSWNSLFFKLNFGGQIGEKKVVVKGCKNGILYMFDAATGQIIWTLNPPAIARATHTPSFVQQSPADYKQIPNVQPPPGSGLISRRDGHVMAAWDPRDPDIYQLRWSNDPSKDPDWINPNSGTGAIEADVAFDGKTLYVGTYNSWTYGRMLNVGPFDPISAGRMAVPPPSPRPINSTLYAIDAVTGKVKWSAFIDGVGFRGGNTVSGGVVYTGTSDGYIRMFDADTGKILSDKFIGSGVIIPPVIAADASGKFRLFQIFGRAFSGVGTNVPGGLMVYGLPDKLPEPQVVTKEVIKEVVKEVPKEVIKEVPKEVTKTVTVETISPISYAIVGVGVVLIVVAGVIVSRRKKA